MGNSSSNSAWAVWLLIIVILFVCIGIIIWIAIDSYNNPSDENVTEISQDTNIIYQK